MPKSNLGTLFANGVPCENWLLQPYHVGWVEGPSVVKAFTSSALYIHLSFTESHRTLRIKAFPANFELSKRRLTPWVKLEDLEVEII